MVCTGHPLIIIPFGHLLSSPPCIIGNIGSSLSGGRTNLHLYFSHDGGFSWLEVDENYWEFQFAAFGSIIVTVPKWRQAQSIR